MSSQDYYTVQEVVTDGDIQVTQYRNRVTGTTIFSVYVESPIVKGDILFATEAQDDDGLPHTLEHLVFLGSEDYPYKGVLDRLANKCFADGTNAYTDTDHTNYTFSTAGCGGFLKLLPVYLEHLLFPTLTDAAYLTEVHHINGEGEDAGVVYCEMQARENTGQSLCNLEMLRAMYPGKSGYKYETGGLMKNFRESTTNVKVRDYHKQFYRTQNLCIIVTGPLGREEICAAIKPVEDKIVARGLHKLDFQRPWMTPVEPLKSSVEKKVKYASDTDDDGLVYIGFRGPNVITDYKDLIALSILIDYLNDTPISPIQRDFVESEEPYCSSVDEHFIENSLAIFYFEFESVGKEYLDKVKTKLLMLLDDIYSRREKFYLERLRTIISRKMVRILSTAETSPRSIVIGPIIGHFLYGKDDISQRCREIPILKEFLNYTDQYWLDLIYKYMIGPEARHVTVLGEPSQSEMRAMSEAEKNRLAKQKDRLKDDLPSLAEKLRLSIEANEVPAPDNLFDTSDSPTITDIRYHSIERNTLEEGVLPIKFQYDSFKTSFVNIHVLMNTSNTLSKLDRLYLPILSEMHLECPIMRNGEEVSYQTVCEELFSDTVAYGASIGLNSNTYSPGLLSMLYGISLQVEVEKYEKAVQWINELLYFTVFDPVRIKTVATRMSSDISQCKRSGLQVAQNTLSSMIYQSNSNKWASNFLRQKKFLAKVIKDPKSAQRDLTRIRDILTMPQNILVHVGTNKEKIDFSTLHLPWLKLVPDEVKSKYPLVPHLDYKSIVKCTELYDPIEDPRGIIVAIGSVESNYFIQVVKSIDSPLHPDLPALYVLIQYLCQLEGPLWRNIRGPGLSYSYNINISPDSGLLQFYLVRTTQLLEAYARSKEVVDSYLNGETDYDADLLHSAKSSLIFSLIKKEENPTKKSLQSLVAYLKCQDINYSRQLIEKVTAVTAEDLKRVGPIHLRSIFESDERRTAVCCHPIKVDALLEGFQKSLNLTFKQFELENEGLCTISEEKVSKVSSILAERKKQVEATNDINLRGNES